MIVYTGGTFDLIHTGHLYLLRQCRLLGGAGGQVVVSLNMDDFIEEYKGHRPIQNYLERSEVLSALRDVDRVIPNLGGRDSKPAIEAISPDIIAIGRDWYSPDDQKYCNQMGFTAGWLRERQIKLSYLDLLEGRSSTRIRERTRDMKQ